MAASGIPRPEPTVLAKADLLKLLRRIDSDRRSSERVLRMENDFRTRIASHIQSLPARDADFSKFNTSPFVVMFYALRHGLAKIREIEQAILPAKEFSSMETSAGRMVEAVVLPQYGWEFAPSGMQTVHSAIDGRKLSDDTLRLATLKSGPRCLNDEMSENFADAILQNCVEWANEASVKKIDFTYGVLYGTRKQSNKKDWHILRNIARKFPSGMRESPEGKWHCRFTKNKVDVSASIRIGIDLWSHISGHDLAFLEIGTALLRACVRPSEIESRGHSYSIADLGEIVSLDGMPDGFNVKILQRSQLEWLFFFARHFCDALEPGDWNTLARRG